MIITTRNDLPVVCVVHAPFGAANLAEIARASEGICRPVILIREPVAESAPNVLTLARHLFEVHVVGDAVAATARRLNAVGITTFHDGELEYVDSALRELALPGYAAGNPWDKMMQRTRLRSRQLSRVRAEAVDSEDDFRSAISALGLPAVVKPRRSVGGQGVALLYDEEDVAYQISNRQQWSGLMVEDMLPEGRHPKAGSLADFVSVETSCTDRPHHIAIFDKLPVTIVRRAGPDGSDIVSVTGDVTPSRLPEKELNELKTYVADCLVALHVRWRMTHTEVKLTPAGPEVIEVNGRVGGHLNRLLRLIGGPDLVRAALGLAIGIPPPVSTAGPRGFAMGYFPAFTRHSGQVRSSVSRRDLQALPGVVGVDELARAGADRADSRYRLTNVTLFADTAEMLDASLATTARRLFELFADDL
jgi:hypothetical protein